MAGLGFKDFQVGEVLTSSDVDGYLMQQTVMRFADSGARGSALGTAAGTGVPLAEGMVSYLQDTDSVEFFDGSSWRPASGVVGVSYALGTANVTFANTASGTAISLSYTPLDASNLLEVTFSGYMWMFRVSGFSTERRDAENFGLERDGTPLYTSGEAFSGRALVASSSVAAYSYPQPFIRWVGSAGSTSAQTFAMTATAPANTNVSFRANHYLMVREYAAGLVV